MSRGPFSASFFRPLETFLRLACDPPASFSPGAVAASIFTVTPAHGGGTQSTSTKSVVLALNEFMRRPSLFGTPTGALESPFIATSSSAPSSFSAGLFRRRSCA